MVIFVPSDRRALATRPFVAIEDEKIRAAQTKAKATHLLFTVCNLTTKAKARHVDHSCISLLGFGGFERLDVPRPWPVQTEAAVHS